jgi:hypothetical protein
LFLTTSKLKLNKKPKNVLINLDQLKIDYKSLNDFLVTINANYKSKNLDKNLTGFGNLINKILNENIKLIAHAKYHIINCSSVSNELVLANVPVIATGRSWFTGLEVFIEPKSWDSILNDTVTVNEQNRNKWCNWWFTRQVKKDDIWDKIKEIYMRYPIY